MKRSLMLIAAVVIVGTSSLAIAQMNDKDKSMLGDKSGMMGDMMGKGGMMGGKGMMGMMGMCHMMMNKPSLVGVSDGVVVLSGKKLYKYDNNLNLVKEAEIKVDEMPMMGGGMMGDGMKDSDNSTGQAANADEHAAHHPKQ